jgi:hypothetical protein
MANTITGTLAHRATKAVPRYVATKKGRLFSANSRGDSAVFSDTYPKTRPQHVHPLIALLSSFSLRHGQQEYGLSIKNAWHGNALRYDTARWWVATWLADGYIKLLPFKLADTRDVLPGHWRPTSALASHLERLCVAFDSWEHLRADLGFTTSRGLPDIDALRVSGAGTTDYDHDIGFQRILGAMLSSENLVRDAPWRAERVMRVPVTTHTHPWTFDRHGDGAVSYQPDGLYVERDVAGRLRMGALEYERSQTRRDAWGHIERFLGYVHTSVAPTQPVVLRFIVDSRTREQTYVELLNAYTDYLHTNPKAGVLNQVTVAVASRDRILSAANPLADEQWARVLWTPGQGAGSPRVHHRTSSPYDTYF